MTGQDESHEPGDGEAVRQIHDPAGALPPAAETPPPALVQLVKDAFRRRRELPPPT